LRPNDVNPRVKLAETLYFLGRQPEAIDVLRSALAMDPNNADVHYQLGDCQLLLGDNAGGLASLTRSLQLRDDPDRRPDLHVAQFYNGILPRDEFESRASNALQPIALVTYLFALLDHPDSKQRDPEFVLRTLKERSVSIVEFRWRYFVEAMARMELEDWSGAYDAIKDRFKLPFAMLMNPVCYDFMRAVICSHVGSDTEARAFFAQGNIAMDALTEGNAAAWEHSDAARWRRDAEAALKK
jgi:tetratricopeptide (TPR) repeat protein